MDQYRPVCGPWVEDPDVEEMEKGAEHTIWDPQNKLKGNVKETEQP